MENLPTKQELYTLTISQLRLVKSILVDEIKDRQRVTRYIDSLIKRKLCDNDIKS